MGQCPSGGKDGSATKKNLVSRLLIHVQFSLSTHFYVITDIWTVTDRAHFENCCVNDSLWFDKSCRDTGSCVASIVLLREHTAPETICLAVCSGFRWAALDAGMYCVRQGHLKPPAAVVRRHMMPSLLSALDWRYFTIHVELT